MLAALLICALLIQSCTLCANLLLLCLLIRLYNRQSQLSGSHASGQRRAFQRGSITFVVLKLLSDISAHILVIIPISSRRAMIEKAPDSMVDKLSLLPISFDMAINICFRISMTCIAFLEFLLLWLTFRNVNHNRFILIWRRSAPFLMLVLTVTKFIPLIRLHDLELQFWTVAGTSSLDFSSFGLIYSWLTATLHLRQNVDRRKILFRCAVICFSVAALELVALVVGLRFPFLQLLLLEVSLLIVTASSSIRLILSGQSIDARVRQNRTPRPNVPTDISNRESKVRNITRPGTSRMRESEDSKALYANANWAIDYELGDSLTTNNARSVAYLHCTYCPRGLHQDMCRKVNALMSEEKDPVLIKERMLAQWPFMAGNGEQAWLSHLLGQETVEVMPPSEAEGSSAGEVQDLHHWTV